MRRLQLSLDFAQPPAGFAEGDEEGPPGPTPRSATPGLAMPRSATPGPATTGAAVAEGYAAVLEADASVPAPLRAAALSLTDRLTAALGRPVRLVVTDNRRTMVSARVRGPRIEVRLHHMFLEADAAVVAALGRYLAHREREAGAVIDAFIEAQRHRIGSARRRRTTLRTRGAVHDLGPLFRALLADFPPGAMEGVRVTWGRRVRRRSGQRSIQLGTYIPRDQLIRIHPVLDQAWVPSFYVSTVLFHEMLHHAQPPEREGGRVRYHTAAFRARERAFRHHAEAERWEKAHLTRLLRGG